MYANIKIPQKANVVLFVNSEKHFDVGLLIHAIEYGRLYTNLASVEDITYEVALKSTSEQFDKLVPNGTNTPAQSFFDVLETGSDKPVGNLWLGIQNRFDRKVVFIYDITVAYAYRGRGLGKSLMGLVEQESRKAGDEPSLAHQWGLN